MQQNDSHADGCRHPNRPEEQREACGEEHQESVRRCKRVCSEGAVEGQQKTVKGP